MYKCCGAGEYEIVQMLPTYSFSKNINVKTKGILQEIVFFGDYIYKF